MTIRHIQTDHKPICTGCEHSTVAHRSRGNVYIVHCSRFGQTMPTDLDSCDAYSPLGVAKIDGWSARRLTDYHLVDPRPTPQEKGYV